MGLPKPLYSELMSAEFDPDLEDSCDCWLSLKFLSFKAILLFRKILVEMGKLQTDLAFTVVSKNDPE